MLRSAVSPPGQASRRALAFILGRPRAGSGFALAFILQAWVTPVLKPWLDQQPLWLQAIWMLVVWILLMQAIISIIFGRSGWGRIRYSLGYPHCVLILGPLRGIAYLLRLLIH